MPHVVVKLLPGRSAEQMRRLTDAIVRDVTGALSCGDDAVSVSFEEIPSQEWTARVYEPAMQGQLGTLTKKPGYGPVATG